MSIIQLLTSHYQRYQRYTTNCRPSVKYVYAATWEALAARRRCSEVQPSGHWKELGVVQCRWGRARLSGEGNARGGRLHHLGSAVRLMMYVPSFRSSTQQADVATPIALASTRTPPRSSWLPCRSRVMRRTLHRWLTNAGSLRSTIRSSHLLGLGAPGDTSNETGEPRICEPRIQGIVWGHFRTRTNMEGVTSETAQS